ncbi:MAG TPA: substrate-binding domain-containing protein, partial [Segetibacter sp.]
MNKKISMKDIAVKVGVSTALVSYVLNNKEKEARVGKDIALKIRKAASDLNYQPNFIARSLKTGKTNTIGIILADISNPFFSNLARIIEDEAKKFGYTVIFGSSDERADKSGDLIDTLINRQVDGLIIAPAEHTEKQIKLLRKKEVPFVLIDRFFPNVDANYIHTNNFAASYEATEQLIKNGYQKIAIFAYEASLFHMQERIRGYKAALKDNNIKSKRNLLCQVKHASIENDVANHLNALVKDVGANAIFFTTNSLAVQGLKQIIKLGIKIPDEIGVVSFDETDAFDLFYAPITYVKQNLIEIGRESVKMLLESLEKKTKKTTHMKVEAK